MPERIVLHIGTHKTGTTSLQQYLQDNRDLLHSVDVDYPARFTVPTAHAELPLLTVRQERMWPARIRLPEVRDPSWLAAAERHVRDVIGSSTYSTLVFSHEDLSYLRHADEFARLGDLLGAMPVTVVVYLRDKDSYLESYREQLEQAGFPLNDDPTSFTYVEPDSWLLDYDALLGGYRDCFGPSSVTALDYDEIMRAHGSVIPSFMQIIGIERDQLPSIEPYALNRRGEQLRPSVEQLNAVRRRLAQKAPPPQ